MQVLQLHLITHKLFTLGYQFRMQAREITQLLTLLQLQTNMEIFFKQRADGTYFGEFHETKPEGYITQSELPVIQVTENVPATVTAIQFLVQLKLEGINESDILAVINSLPEPNKTIALISYNRATYFERDNPLLLLVGQAFGFNSQKLDEIFINANKI